MFEAPCVGLADLFFSDNRADIARACAICDGCPNRVLCAQLGQDEEFGVWGGIPRARVRYGRPLRAACPQGHQYIPENTATTYRENGSIKARTCRTCARERSAARVAA